MRRSALDAGVLGGYSINCGIPRTTGGPREAERLDVASFDAGFSQCPFARRRHQFHVALVADPALFPHVVVGLVLAAVVIDEIDSLCVGTQELRNAITIADQYSCASVARIKSKLTFACLRRCAIRVENPWWCAIRRASLSV